MSIYHSGPIKETFSRKEDILHHPEGIRTPRKLGQFVLAHTVNRWDNRDSPQILLLPDCVMGHCTSMRVSPTQQ